MGTVIARTRANSGMNASWSSKVLIQRITAMCQRKIPYETSPVQATGRSDRKRAGMPRGATSRTAGSITSRQINPKTANVMEIWSASKRNGVSGSQAVRPT